MPRSRASSRAAFCLALLLPALPAALPAQQPGQAPKIIYAPLSQWKTRPYPVDGFSADFPVVPAMEMKAIPTPLGSFEMRSYLIVDGSAALLLSLCDYGSAIAGKHPAAVLQGAKNGALRNSGSHLLSERPLTLANHPGLEFQAQSDTIRTIDRLYLIGTILYQVQVSAPITEPYPQATAFLDSFQLIPRTAPPH